VSERGQPERSLWAPALDRHIALFARVPPLAVADGGSDLFVSGEPNATWEDATMTQIRTVLGSDLEAVDITAITSRTGFDVNSGAVPPP